MELMIEFDSRQTEKFTHSLQAVTKNLNDHEIQLLKFNQVNREIQDIQKSIEHSNKRQLNFVKMDLFKELKILVDSKSDFTAVDTRLKEICKEMELLN